MSEAWGLDHIGVSFGCAIVDLTGNGNLDIVYNTFDGPPVILRNNSVEGHGS